MVNHNFNEICENAKDKLTGILDYLITNNYKDFENEVERFANTLDEEDVIGILKRGGEDNIKENLGYLLHLIFSVTSAPEKMVTVSDKCPELFAEEDMPLDKNKIRIIYNSFYYASTLYIHFILLRSIALEDKSGKIEEIENGNYNKLKEFINMMAKEPKNGANEFIRHLRNSLAHGNFIFKKEKEEIEEKIEFWDVKPNTEILTYTYRCNLELKYIKILVRLIRKFYLKLGKRYFKLKGLSSEIRKLTYRRGMSAEYKKQFSDI